MLTKQVLLVALLAHVALIPGIVQADTGDQVWTRFYYMPTGEPIEARAIAETLDGGYIVCGKIMRAGHLCPALVKTDDQGQPQWSRVIPPGVGIAKCVEAEDDGGYVVGGTWGVFTPALDYDSGFLLKVDATGDSLWMRRYYQTPVNSISHASDGGHVFASTSLVLDGGGQVVGEYGAVVKLDSDGAMQWRWGSESNYDPDATAKIREARQASDGGYFAVGMLQQMLPDWSWVGGAWLIRFDAHGDTLWTRSHGSPWLDEGLAAVQTSDGGFAVVGLTEADAYPDPDCVLLKFNPDGAYAWGKKYAMYGPAVGSGIVKAGSVAEGFVLAGACNAGSYLIGSGATGCIRWSRLIEGPALPYSPVTIQPTAGGGYVVCGVYTDDANLVGVSLSEGGADGIPAGASECSPLTGTGPPTDQYFAISAVESNPNYDPECRPEHDPPCCPIEFPHLTFCHYGPPEAGDALCCFLYVCPPYVERFDYNLDAESIASGVTIASVILPTGFFGADVHTSTGDTLVDPPVGAPLPLGDGVTSLWVDDIPMLLDMETFVADDFPLGMAFNCADSVAIGLRVQALAEGTLVEEESVLPVKLSVAGPYPNPAQRVVAVTVGSVEPGPLDVSVVDAQGRLVAMLYRGRMDAGSRRFDWETARADGRRVPAGVYYLVVRGATTEARKTVILR